MRGTSTTAIADQLAASGRVPSDPETGEHQPPCVLPAAPTDNKVTLDNSRYSGPGTQAIAGIIKQRQTATTWPPTAVAPEPMRFPS